MSRPEKAVKSSLHGQMDCQTNPNISSILQYVTASVGRGLHYDIEKQDREKLELLESSSFSVPVMDSSSRITLCLKDMDSTVGNLLQTFGEHAQSAEDDLPSDSSNSQKEKRKLQPDQQGREKINERRMKNSDYPKECLICNKTFKNVEQLVSHFMEKSQKDVWPDSVKNLQQTVTNRVNTNKSGSGLAHVPEEIPLTNCTLVHACKRNKKTALMIRENSPKNTSRKLHNNVGKRKYVKRQKVKSSSKDKNLNNSGKETKTCAVKPKGQHLNIKKVNSSTMAQQVKHQMQPTPTPISTSKMMSATSTAHPIITLPRKDEDVSCEGHPRDTEPSTTPQTSSTAQVTLTANTRPKPLEIMKKLTGLLALYRAKVQQETGQESNLILSTPAQPQVSVASASLAPSVSYKRKYGSLEKSQLVSDNQLLRRKIPQRSPVASVSQQSRLLEPRRICLESGRAASKNSSNTVSSNHSDEYSNKVLKVVDTSGKMVEPTKTIDTHSNVNTVLRPLYPLLKSRKWIIYHLPATVTSTSPANPTQVKGIFPKAGHENQEDVFATPFPSQEKTCPQQSDLRCPVKNITIMPIVQGQKLGQSQVCVNQLSGSILPYGMAPVKGRGPCAAGSIGTLPGGMEPVKGSDPCAAGNVGTSPGGMAPLKGRGPCTAGSIGTLPGGMAPVKESGRFVAGNVGTLPGGMEPVKESGPCAIGNVGTLPGGMEPVKESGPCATGNVGTLPGGMEPVKESGPCATGNVGTLPGGMQPVKGSGPCAAGNVGTLPGGMEPVKGSNPFATGNVGTLPGGMEPVKGSNPFATGNVGTLPGGIPTVKGSGPCAADNGVWITLSRRQSDQLGIETSAKTHSKLLQSPLTTSCNNGHQFRKNVTSSGQTSGLLQSSIILQPTTTSPIARRSIVHVPLLEVQDHRPRDGDTKLPVFAELKTSSASAMGSDICPLDNLNAAVQSSCDGSDLVDNRITRNSSR